MSRWIQANWFLLALALVFLAGHFGATRFAALGDQSAIWQSAIWPSTIRSTVVMVVMWAMGFTLKSDAVRRNVAKPNAALLAIMTNVVLVPLLCLPAFWGLSSEMGGGLFVAALVPCTLASASVWTRRAGGEESVAMMTTLVTNLACVAVVPLGIQVVLAMQTRVAPLAQMEKLVWFVVVPLVVAQLMRRCGLSSFADRNKRWFSLLAQCGILVMVWMGAVAGHQVAHHGASHDMSTWGVTTVLAVTVLAVAVHLAAMGCGVIAARGLRLTRAEQIAVGISGSQKTLMVGLQIAIDCGVSVLPMLIYHAGQLITDTFIADRWKRSDDET